MTEQVLQVEVRSYGAADAPELAARIWPCYDEVFGDFPDFESWRAGMFARHAARSGYRLVVAADGAAIAGFSWGYIGERGQYWADLVAAELPGAGHNSINPTCHSHAEVAVRRGRGGSTRTMWAAR
jgi:hypothetical protein